MLNARLNVNVMAPITVTATREERFFATDMGSTGTRTVDFTEIVHDYMSEEEIEDGADFEDANIIEIPAGYATLNTSIDHIKSGKHELHANLEITLTDITPSVDKPSKIFDTIKIVKGDLLNVTLYIRCAHIR